MYGQKKMPAQLSTDIAWHARCFCITPRLSEYWGVPFDTSLQLLWLESFCCNLYHWCSFVHDRNTHRSRCCYLSWCNCSVVGSWLLLFSCYSYTICLWIKYNKTKANKKIFLEFFFVIRQRLYISNSFIPSDFRQKSVLDLSIDQISLPSEMAYNCRFGMYGSLEMMLMFHSPTSLKKNGRSTLTDLIRA